jgi:uncharacterized protein (UPF0248 family)
MKVVLQKKVLLVIMISGRMIPQHRVEKITELQKIEYIMQIGLVH